MKKLLLFFFLFLFFPIQVLAFSSSAECTILMDMDSGRILYGNDIYKVKSVASISKIMTATLAIESGKMDDIVEIGDEVLKSYGSAIYLKIGEHMKLEDLVYGLMLRSGNDAALAIANYVSSSVEEFVFKMNEKAKEIGMKNTTFHNPSGLDEEDKGNLSTAYDMAVLTSYAMKNEFYQKIVKTKKHSVKTDGNTYIWHNKNKMLSYPYSTGGKTGYTEIAKRTLVSTAKKDNMNLVVVTLNDPNDWSDHRNLLEEAYETYTNYQILKRGKVEIENEIHYLQKEFYLEEDFFYPLNALEKDSIRLKFELSKKRNYEEGDEVGNVSVFIGEEEVHKSPIYVRSVKKEEISFWKRLLEWVHKLW